MNDFYVYLYMRERTTKHGAAGTPYYVGKGFGDRAFSRKHRVSVPSDLARIIFASTEMNEKDAHQLEMFLICLYGRLDLGTGCLANLTDGGQGHRGAVFSPEWRENISKGLKGVPKSSSSRTRGPRTPERIAQMSEAQRKRHAINGGHSDETRAKMRESQLRTFTTGRVKLTSEQRRANALMAPPISEETRKRMSEASKKRVWSKETCRKRSESLLAYYARKRSI